MNPQMMAMMGKGMMGMGGGMGMPPQMMGKGMMPPNMGGMPPMQQMQQQPAMNQRRPPAPSNAPLAASALASAPPAVQKQMIGEKLFPAISKYQPEMAGKITGMML